jgi:predicted metal-dependent hydrolase
VTGHSGWIARHLELQRRRQAAAPPPTAEEIAALRARAQEALPPRVAYYGARMGLRPNGVRITAARTRFGSCSGKDVLCFSCFLMRYPPEAVDLVVVHELCHIRVKNHGPAFYALLGSVLPDYRERKKLLSAPLPPKPAEP